MIPISVCRHNIGISAQRAKERIRKKEARATPELLFTLLLLLNSVNANLLAVATHTLELDLSVYKSEKCIV